MIKRLVNHGFKDQTRETVFSGLDLFTSDNVNGVGKSAVLEAFKLALVGEVPGRAKKVDDILQFTSLDEMKVEVVSDSGRTPVVVERRFLRQGIRGEKRPIVVNGMGKKYEEGSQWIGRHIGAVSISFDPFEFLNLSDAKKRQWIIAHSPESQGLTLTGLGSLLLGRLVENILGPGIVRSLLIPLGADALDGFCLESDESRLSRFQERLLDVFDQLEPSLCKQVRETLDRLFRNGLPEQSTEENSNAMLRHLKSESLRLKNAVRDQAAALACMGPDFGKSVDEKNASGISESKKAIQSLTQRIESLNQQVEKRRNQTANTLKRDRRMDFLKETISRLVDELNGDMSEALLKMREQLHGKRVDPTDLQDELKQLQREGARRSEDGHEQVARLKNLEDQIKLKRDQLESMCASRFACPVAAEIRCDTDMTPYREILAGNIEALQKEAGAVRPACQKAQEKRAALQRDIGALDTRLAERLRSNREIQREIDLLEEQIQAVEKDTAQVRGRLSAYREEMSVLESEPLAWSGEEGGVGTLEDEISDLKLQMINEQKNLDECLRRQGKIETFSGLDRQKKLWEQELKIVQTTFDLLSGIQEGMVAGISSALEAEVNNVLKLINSDYHFTLNLKSRNFEMGWNRQGKIIPFKTINSAHFVIFIVPFLAALIGRLARTRDKIGLPTLKALCIEAESLTPDNLSALLRGLANMKERGMIDNVLVAHYHSVREADKLFGFVEHILEETPSPVEAFVR